MTIDHHQPHQQQVAIANSTLHKCKLLVADRVSMTCCQGSLSWQGSKCMPGHVKHTNRHVLANLLQQRQHMVMRSTLTRKPASAIFWMPFCRKMKSRLVDAKAHNPLFPSTTTSASAGAMSSQIAPPHSLFLKQPPAFTLFTATAVKHKTFRSMQVTLSLPVGRPHAVWRRCYILHVQGQQSATVIKLHCTLSTCMQALNFLRMLLY